MFSHTPSTRRDSSPDRPMKVDGVWIWGKRHEFSSTPKYRLHNRHLRREQWVAARREQRRMESDVVSEVSVKIAVNRTRRHPCYRSPICVHCSAVAVLAAS